MKMKHLSQRRKIGSGVTKRYGQPFSIQSGKTIPNVLTLGKMLATTGKVFWCDRKQKFYLKSDSSEIYADTTPERVSTIIREFVMQKAADSSTTAPKVTDSLLRGVATVMKTENSMPSPSHERLFPVANGVIRFFTTKHQLLNPGAKFGFTQQCEHDYDPGAKCPGFEKMLQQILPDPSDRRLLQIYLGGSFTGSNLTRRMLLLRGLGGSGKTTLMRIQEALLGRKLVGDRVNHG
jgi:hypothetical protein